MFTSQLADNAGNMKKYSALKKERGNSTKGRLPLWYHNLRARWSNPATHSLPQHQNKHPCKWLESTKTMEEIQVITPLYPQCQILYCQLIDIHPESHIHWTNCRTALAEYANNNNNTLTFYTDGLLANNRTNAADPIMGAAWYSSDTQLSMGFRVWGSASSMNPEAKATLLALEISLHDSTIHIHTDSQATHDMLSRMADNSYNDLTTRHIMKKNCWMTWKRIITTIATKNISLHSHKVLAHSGNLHNDTADLAAKEAARNIPDLEVYNSEKCRFSFTLKHRDLIIKENLWKYLK